jgi:hypothetical protein
MLLIWGRAGGGMGGWSVVLLVVVERMVAMAAGGERVRSLTRAPHLVVRKLQSAQGLETLQRRDLGVAMAEGGRQ